MTTSGTVLAYCEARKGGQGDWGTIDILMRRSLDGGRTWEPRRKIVTPPRRVVQNPVALAQNLARPGEITVNNPVAIVETRPGVVHFLYCIEYARCYYMRSDDDGKTFTTPVDITGAFDRFRPEYDWKVLATGPGHGIRLRRGRLIVPVWLSTGTGGHAHRPSEVSVVYSDDRGKTWERGEMVVRHPHPKNPSETVPLELADGRVLLNIRHETPGIGRGVSISSDGATGWSETRYDAALPEPVCMGSIIRLSKKPRFEKNRVLFANPHNPTGRERRNVSIKLSYDEGETWPVMKTIESGTSGYSDLAVGPGGTVFCFYERGTVDESHYRTKTLCVARLNLEWITGGKDHLVRSDQRRR